MFVLVHDDVDDDDSSSQIRWRWSRVDIVPAAVCVCVWTRRAGRHAGRPCFYIIDDVWNVIDRKLSAAARRK